MVYGIMIHSVDSCQTLHFSNFYTAEGNDSRKKTREQMIMRRILEEHLFQRHSSTSEMSRLNMKSQSSRLLEQFMTTGSSSHLSGDYSNGHKDPGLIRTALGGFLGSVGLVSSGASNSTR